MVRLRDWGGSILPAFGFGMMVLGLATRRWPTVAAGVLPMTALLLLRRRLPAR
jgi:hypothetical protein